MMDDLAFMRRCLALAEASREAGETPVGSLIVRGDRIRPTPPEIVSGVLEKECLAAWRQPAERSHGP
jgi:hypothetical protein